MTHTIPLVDISIQPIELCKLLKIANMVSGGGEAKIVISEGYVLLNDEVEYQKRKKVYHNDIVEFNGELIQVNCVNTDKATQDLKNPEKAKASKLNKQKKNSSPKQKINTGVKHETTPPSDAIRAKRKPISF